LSAKLHGEEDAAAATSQHGGRIGMMRKGVLGGRPGIQTHVQEPPRLQEVFAVLGVKYPGSTWPRMQGARVERSKAWTTKRRRDRLGRNYPLPPSPQRYTFRMLVAAHQA